MTSLSSAADTGLPVSRRQLEHMIEDAIAMLDLLDPDPDLEPSLGSQMNGAAALCDLEGDNADLEPSLGSLDGRINQAGWSAGSNCDAEDEHDGREPDSDYEPDSDDELTGDEKEPSLGSFDRLVNQEHSYRQTANTWFPGQDQEADSSEYGGSPHLASDADVDAARAAARSARSLAARRPGLTRKRPRSRSHTSICNVGPILPMVAL